MSVPREPDKVNLIVSVFSPEKGAIHRVMEELEEEFGSMDWLGPEIFFDRTRYYEREMGWPLHRRFVSFENLIAPEDLVDVKLKTNEIEKRHMSGDSRLVNIDPGYISPERLVLATGKNYTHRIYLRKGIYADLTLVFKRGSFRALEWTYRDYSDPEMTEVFNGLRRAYMEKLRGLKRIDQEHDSLWEG